MGHRLRTPLRRTGWAACVAVGVAACFAGFAAAASLPVASQRLVAISRAETVPPTTCTVPATADTYTDESATTANHGTAADLRVAARSNRAKRTFVRFDLSGCAIPATAAVRSASLRLHMWTAPSNSRSYGAYRLTSSWAESTLTWESPQPSVATTATSTTSTGTTAGVTLSWSVTADVQAHVTTPASNHGWLVRDTAETGTTTFEAAFRSGQYGTAAQRPSLQVTYHR